MIRKLSSIVSIILNPLLMPTILFGILFYFTAFIGNTLSDKQMLYILLIIFITTFLMPASCILILRYSNNILSFKLYERKERYVPYMFISLFYIITTWLFFTKIKLNNIFLIILITISALMIILTIITFFWKISTQSAAISAVIGVLLGITYKYPQDNLLFPLIIIILLAGVGMSSKLYLNENNHKEIYWGSALGFLFCFFSVYLFA